MAKNYVERLNNILIDYKDSDINDYTYLYSDFKSKKLLGIITFIKKIYSHF